MRKTAEPQVGNMNDAPRDGTRILLRVRTYGWSNAKMAHVATGTKVVEASWRECWGRYDWWAWCGDARTQSTERLVPLAWALIPKELRGDK